MNRPILQELCIGLIYSTVPDDGDAGGMDVLESFSDADEFRRLRSGDRLAPACRGPVTLVADGLDAPDTGRTSPDASIELVTAAATTCLGASTTSGLGVVGTAT